MKYDPILYLSIALILIILIWEFILAKRVKIKSSSKEKIDTLFLILLIIFLGILLQVSLQIWSILAALIVYRIGRLHTNMDYWEKQEDILKSLYEETKYLTNTQDGHIKYFRDCLKPKRYPHHNMSLINIDAYLPIISHKINSEPTLDVINKIKKVNDKITMVNDYRKDGKTWKIMVEKYLGGGYVAVVLDEIEKKLEEIQRIIKSNFKLKFE